MPYYQYYPPQYYTPNSRYYQNPYIQPRYYYDSDYYYLPPSNQYNNEPEQKFEIDYL